MLQLLTTMFSLLTISNASSELLLCCVASVPYSVPRHNAWDWHIYALFEMIFGGRISVFLFVFIREPESLNSRFD